MTDQDDNITALEKNGSPNHAHYILRLFVTGASPNSIKAITNIQMICDKHIREQYTLEIIDIYQEAALAEKEQLIALPLLIKKQPLPERRLIGNMSDHDKVLKGLGITP
jgi:circadian clock protein KaiB